MTGERLQRIEAVFAEAVELSPEQRGAFLDRACADDAALRAEVESLLRCDAGTEGVLPHTPLELHAAVRRAAYDPSRLTRIEDELSLPARLGPYLLTSELGRGGMGVVYRGEQEIPRREVAVKVIRPGVLSARSRRRFEYEVDVLARLHHHGIAQIYDAGSAAATGASGIPLAYYAMELVNGSPITRHARELELSVRERLALFVQVCDAVQHAHQNGVIHRDLKPGNLLVSKQGQIKVLDFGVARVIDDEQRLTTMGTDVGQIVGTLPYMSPEQVSGDPGAVDTRSDVYALGVNLYELLTGSLPHDIERCSLPEAARVIRDDPPRPLSRIDRIFRGDVETIVAKALEKDPTRRYQSAADLARDLRSHLAGEPIEARRDSGWYMLRKTLARYRAIAATLAVAMLVVTVAAGMLVSMVREQSRLIEEVTAARDAESIARIEAELLSEFLQARLRESDPRHTGQAELSLRAFLDQTVSSLDRGDLAKTPLAEAATRLTVGASYVGMGAFDAAERQVRAALVIQESILPPDDAAVARTRHQLGVVLDSLGAYRPAAEQLSAALHVLEKDAALAENASDTCVTLAAVLIHLQDFDEAERHAHRAIEIVQNAGLGPTTALYNSYNQLGVISRRRGNIDAALRHYHKSLEVQRAAGAIDTHDHARTLSNIGTAYLHARRVEQALPYLEQAHELRLRLFGPDHVEIGAIVNALGGAYSLTGQADKAIDAYRRAYAIRLNHLGPDHPQTHTVAVNLAEELRTAGRLDDAAHLALDVLARRRDVLPNGRTEFANSLIQSIRMLESLGRYQEAEPLMVEALLEAEQSPPTGWRSGRLLFVQGAIESGLGRLERGEQLLMAGITEIEADPTAPVEARRESLECLRQHYERAGRLVQADEVRERIERLRR